jgi:mannose-6-phosphate isomerase-like protein (cupin superfamily)
MKPVVTRFDEKKAGVYQNGNLKAFDLVPEGIRYDLIFHWVELAHGFKTEPEKNDVKKAFLFFEGEAEVNQDGETVKVKSGDVLWLPAGSTHVIQNYGKILRFIVVKAK